MRVGNPDRSFLVVVAVGVGVAHGAAPQNHTAAQTASAVQQESTAQQMTSIADSAAGTQTSSSQAQLKTVQQQYGVTRNSEAPSDMAPPPKPDEITAPALSTDKPAAAPSVTEPDP